MIKNFVASTFSLLFVYHIWQLLRLQEQILKGVGRSMQGLDSQSLHPTIRHSLHSYDDNCPNIVSSLSLLGTDFSECLFDIRQRDSQVSVLNVEERAPAYIQQQFDAYIIFEQYDDRDYEYNSLIKAQIVKILDGLTIKGQLHMKVTVMQYHADKSFDAFFHPKSIQIVIKRERFSHITDSLVDTCSSTSSMTYCSRPGHLTLYPLPNSTAFPEIHPQYILPLVMANILSNSQLNDLKNFFKGYNLSYEAKVHTTRHMIVLSTVKAAVMKLARATQQLGSLSFIVYNLATICLGFEAPRTIKNVDQLQLVNEKITSLSNTLRSCALIDAYYDYMQCLNSVRRKFDHIEELLVELHDRTTDLYSYYENLLNLPNRVKDSASNGLMHLKVYAQQYFALFGPYFIPMIIPLYRLVGALHANK